MLGREADEEASDRRRGFDPWILQDPSRALSPDLQVPLLRGTCNKRVLLKDSKKFPDLGFWWRVLLVLVAGSDRLLSCVSVHELCGLWWATMATPVSKVLSFFPWKLMLFWKNWKCSLFDNSKSLIFEFLNFFCFFVFVLSFHFSYLTIHEGCCLQQSRFTSI